MFEVITLVNSLTVSSPASSNPEKGEESEVLLFLHGKSSVGISSLKNNVKIILVNISRDYYSEEFSSMLLGISMIFSTFPSLISEYSMSASRPKRLTIPP